MNRKLWIKIVKLENQLIDFRFLIIKLANKCNACVEEANQAAQNAQFAAEDAELHRRQRRKRMLPLPARRKQLILQRPPVSVRLAQFSFKNLY